MAKAAKGDIRVGIGGWTFEPWRGAFYPDGLAQKRELEYASRAVTAIEVNGTYYGSQKPATFASWAAQVPDGFVFTLKASRYCTNRKVLAEAGESIDRFVSQGITELGDKLGPILWQFMGTKKLDLEDFGAFLKLLPEKQDGIALRHAIEPRHESFRDPAFIALARKANVAVVIADSTEHPQIADVTGDFVYARLQDAQDDIETGYDAAALDRWATVAKEWAAGGSPQGFAYSAPDDPAGKQARDVFVFMINGAKRRAPAAAKALIGRL